MKRCSVEQKFRDNVCSVPLAYYVETGNIATVTHVYLPMSLLGWPSSGSDTEHIISRVRARPLSMA